MPGHRSLRALLALAAAVVLPVVGAAPAAAHDEVVATTPAAEATVPTPLPAVELQLSSPPQELGTEVRVTGPDGSAVSEGVPEVLDTTVRQPLAEGLAAGRYAVEWRVTSGDGHPVTGSSTFTIDGGAEASSAPATAAGTSPSSEPADVGVGEASATGPADSSSTALVVGGLVVLLLAAVVLWRLRGRT